MDRQVLVFRRDSIFAQLSGTAEDLQRRVSLLGCENADKSFAGVSTRRRRNDISTQPWRYHEDEEVEFIVAGRMEIEYKTDVGEIARFEVGAGDVFYIPAGVRHRADSIGEELCVVVVFCPARYSTAEGQISFVDAHGE